MYLSQDHWDYTVKPLLLLHYRADCNTNDIWRAAIRSGWSTKRIHDVIPDDLFTPGRKIRYYGNILHADRIKDRVPFTFTPIDLTVLAKTPLTKRRVELVRFDALTVIDKPTFIKPAKEKWFEARIYQPGELPAPEGGTLPSDLIYVQEPVDMINEVRCFCLDGEILTASYYRVGHQYCSIGLDGVDRPKELDEMVRGLAPFYPRGVVLDFAYTSKREWAFIEPNESWAAGTYSSCPERCLEVIEASQEDRVIHKTMKDYEPSDADAEQISRGIEEQVGWVYDQGKGKVE